MALEISWQLGCTKQNNTWLALKGLNWVFFCITDIIVSVNLVLVQFLYYSVIFKYYMYHCLSKVSTRKFSVLYVSSFPEVTTVMLSVLHVSLFPGG